MALTSALYTGLSGLAANSERLNVVGNNIANANTVSFKSSRTLFTPQFYLTDSGGTAPTSTTGGTNPNQSGLGVQVSAIEKDFTPGAIQATGKSTDLAVDGAGFFVLQGNNQQFTRDGAFNLDSGNNLVATSGDFVQGYGVDANFKVIPGKLQNVKIPLGAASTAESTKAITLQGNFDTAGQIAAGASILNSQLLTRVGGGAAPTSATLLTDVADASSPGTALFSIGQVFTLQGSKGGSNTPPQLFKVTSSSTLNDFATVFNGGLGINTTVPADPAEPTPGTTFETDATNPNAIRIVVAGNPGTANKLALGASSFTAGAASPLTFIDGANAAGFKSNPSGESINTSAVVYDSLGNPVTIDLTAVYQSASSNGTQWTFYATSPDNKAASGSLVIGSGTLNFDTNGKLLSASTPTLTIDRSGTGAKSPFSINADFSGKAQNGRRKRRRQTNRCRRLPRRSRCLPSRPSHWQHRLETSEYRRSSDRDRR